MAATLGNVLVSCLHLSEVFLSWSVRERRRESNPCSTSATLASSWTNLQGHRSSPSSAPPTIHCKASSHFAPVGGVPLPRLLLGEQLVHVFLHPL